MSRLTIPLRPDTPGVYSEELNHIPPGSMCKEPFVTLRATEIEPGLVVSVLAGNSRSPTPGRARDDRRDDSDPFEPRIKVDRDEAIRMAFAGQTYYYSEHPLRAGQLGAVDSHAAHRDAPYVHDAGSAQ